MIFKETPLKGAFMIELEPRADDRGYFARTFCHKELATHGLAVPVAQMNTSFNHKRGTLRGMHYQAPPYGEIKLIRCTRGAVYDVIIDLRPDSPTHRQWLGVELTADNGTMLYVPENFAHGFQTLDDGCELSYVVSQYYTPEAERGVRFDDPAFSIEWPLPVAVISSKDRSWPDYQQWLDAAVAPETGKGRRHAYRRWSR